jgi:hypothetical protein
MFTIITALVAEHRQFEALFQRVERELAACRETAEVQRWTCGLESLLRRHAAAEEDLLLLVLDHLPEQRRRCDRLYTEHQEINAQFTQVHQTSDLEQARKLLQAGLLISRRHFQYEERIVFPLLERFACAETLAKLGLFWRSREERPNQAWGQPAAACAPPPFEASPGVSYV